MSELADPRLDDYPRASEVRRFVLDALRTARDARQPTTAIAQDLAPRLFREWTRRDPAGHFAHVAELRRIITDSIGRARKQGDTAQACARWMSERVRDSLGNPSA